MRKKSDNFGSMAELEIYLFIYHANITAFTCSSRATKYTFPGRGVEPSILGDSRTLLINSTSGR